MPEHQEKQFQIPAEILDYTGNHCMQLVIQLRATQKKNDELQRQLEQAQAQNEKLVKIIEDSKIEPK
jgi:hypothetical protein